MLRSLAFGRLEAHAQVEGTGLGLVSALKIVEAHGGEAFVEGHADGTPASAPFTTAQGRYPSLLAPSFLTAFVIACPAQPAEAVDGGETSREPGRIAGGADAMRSKTGTDNGLR